MARRSAVTSKKAQLKGSRKKKKSGSRTPAKKPEVKLSASISAKDLKAYHTRMVKAGAHRVANVPESRATVTRWISSQSIAIDTALGGGLPMGKVIEILGPPHVGKSTFADHVGAQAQREKGLYILADTELSRSLAYMKKIGVNVDDVQYLEWEDTEQFIENVVNSIYETIQYWKALTSAPIVIVWDALGSTAAQDDIEKGLGSQGSKKASKPGAAAKAMRMAMRQIAPAIAGTNILLIVLNHEYEVVNSYGAGPKRKPYGGQGLGYASSLQLGLWPSQAIKDTSGKILGREVRAYFNKDRITGKTNQSVSLAFISGVGIDNTYSVFSDLKDSNIIVTSGSWSSINLDGEVLSFQGWKGLSAKCQEDETLWPRLVSVYQTILGEKDAAV